MKQTNKRAQDGRKGAWLGKSSPRSGATALKEADTSNGPPLEPQNFVTQSLTVILDVYRIYGFRFDLDGTDEHSRHLRSAFKRSVDRLSALSALCAPGVEGAFKLFKYKLAAFFSAMADQDLPKRPWSGDEVEDNPLVILGGSAYRFVRKAKTWPEMARMSFATSVLQSKKGLPRPTESQLKKGESSTFEELTAEQKVSVPVDLIRNRDGERKIAWSDINSEYPEDVFFSENVFRREAKRTVREVFTRQYTVEDRMHAFFPSTSANYVRSRSGLGAVGAILEEHPDLLDGLKVPGGGIYVRSGSREESRVQHGGTGVVNVDYDEFMTLYSKFYDRLIEKALWVEMPFATPLGLAEALKVRVITKGPPLAGTCLKSIQHFMRTTLAKVPAFQLVGRQVDNRVLLEMLGSKLPAGHAFLSGDYTNATNALHGWASKIVAEEISDAVGLEEGERALLLRSLTGHIVEYNGQQRNQTTGQLMGSVTSFPVLCLVNAIVCRYAMEFGAGRKIPLTGLSGGRARLLINGDDCLFVTNELGRRTWERVAAFVGLSPSIGKVFWSRAFCNVNSTNFLYRPDEPEQQPWSRDGGSKPPSALEVSQGRIVLRQQPYLLTRFVNLGLVLGYKRSGGAVGRADICDSAETLGSRHRELHETCPPELWERVHACFLRHNAKALEDIRLPYYIPESLGGVGMYGVPSWLDCKLANGAILNWSKLKRQPAAVGQKTPWMVRKLALENLLRGQEPYVLTDPTKIAAWTQAIGRACAATMFDSRLSLADLYKSLGAVDGAKQKFRQNRRFWEYLLKSGLAKPLDRSFIDVEGEPGLHSKEYACARFAEKLAEFVVPTLGLDVQGQTVSLERRQLLAQETSLGFPGEITISARVPLSLETIMLETVPEVKAEPAVVVKNAPLPTVETKEIFISISTAGRKPARPFVEVEWLSEYQRDTVAILRGRIAESEHDLKSGMERQKRNIGGAAWADPVIRQVERDSLEGEMRVAQRELDLILKAAVRRWNSATAGGGSHTHLTRNLQCIDDDGNEVDVEW